MAVGEAPESETPGDTQDLTLSPSQMALFGAINATATPLVVVLVEPRPRVLGAIPARAAAVLMAYLPCVHGGQAIAEILFGVTNPSGRLPLTYPQTTGDLDVYYHHVWNATFAGLPESTFHDPLYDFGTGLSYSTLTYGALSINPPVAAAGDFVNVTFTVKNSGPYDAKESSLLFVNQLYRAAITPEARMLKGFTKSDIAAGTTATVTVTLDTADLAYWTPSLELQVDAGAYALTVGGLTGQLTLSSPARFDYVPPATGAASAAAAASGGGRAFRLVRPSEAAQLAAADSAVLAASLQPAAAGLLDALMAEVDAAGVRGTGAAARRIVLHQLRQRLAGVLREAQA
jgi:beta-glucosidase